MKKLIMLLALLSSVFAFNAQKPVERNIYNIPKQPLSRAEVKDLLHMREEEKLARDVYLALYKRWRMPVFRNIAKSEEWHMHMIELLLNKYNLPDPVKRSGARVGVFENPQLQQLYYKLTSNGYKSLRNALKVGALIEDLDIYDLQKAIRESDNRDIKFVYNALKHGSENHMRAFVRLLRRYGGDYVPKYISVAYFQKILSKRSVNHPKFVGKVVKVYQLPGLKKGVYWWMADVRVGNKIVRVAIVPTWIMGSINVMSGDRVRVKGYRGPYSFIACEFRDIKTGFDYMSNSPNCQ